MLWHFTHSAVARFARSGVVVAMCLLLGAHWAALQGVAWTGMLISYTQKNSFVEAVEKTFGGANPCELCRAVQAGQNEEQKKDGRRVVVKLDALLTTAWCLQAPAVASVRYFPDSRISAARFVTPPTPPPLAV